MTSIQTRLASLEDILLLSDYRYDGMALKQLAQRVKLKPHARQLWEAAAAGWVNDADCYFATAWDNNILLGCVIVKIAENTPGLLPDRVGVLEDLILDIHAAGVSGGVGRELVTIARSWLSDQGISILRICVSAPSSVEQAFWIALGAKQKGLMYCLDNG